MPPAKSSAAEPDSAPRPHRHSHRHRHHRGSRRTLLPGVSIFLFLLNVFWWVAFAYLGFMVVSAISIGLAWPGFLAGMFAERKIQRHGGQIPGWGAAVTGKWLNGVMMVGSLAMFLLQLLQLIMNGQLL